MKRYRSKSFKGLVPYGNARVAMFASMFSNLTKLEARGCYSPLEGMQTRGGVHRSLCRKRAAI